MSNHIVLARRDALAFALIALFGSVALAALWQLEWRWLGTFDSSLAQFDGEDLTAAKSGAITIQQFLDPNCPCNRYIKQHSEDLKEKYSHQNVRFEYLSPQSADAAAIPASPAVAIWAENGELAYFGAYSNGIICNAKTSFIEPVLIQLQTGENPNISNTAGVGCFCPWPGQVKTKVPT